MKLALLGADDEALQLIRSLEAAGHELVAAFDVDGQESEMAWFFPRTRMGADWEDALLSSTCDAVVVARARADRSDSTGIASGERREDQLRKLAQASMPALVVHPACEAIVGFEIEMIRRDCQAVLVPYVPHILHPAVDELLLLVNHPRPDGLASIDNQPLGTIEQIVFERHQSDRDRGAVLAQFARDIALLQRLMGDVHKLTASGPPGRSQADPLGPKPKEKLPLSNLSVHLAGQRNLSARWSLIPGGANERGKLNILGSQGSVVLDMPTGEQPWSLSHSSRSEPLQTYAAGADLDAWGRRIDSFLQAGAPPPLSWLVACRAMEATAAIDRSLERGRTIELYNEEHTEAESFKGVMAVGGCLLLCVALAMLLAAAAVEGLQLPLRNSPIWRLWPVFLLAPIVVFLLLQLLQTVANRPASGRPPGSFQK